MKRNANFAALLKRRSPGGIAQLARALAWHARGRRFDSDYLHNQTFLNMSELDYAFYPNA
jgi:hypothetical protein